MVGPGRALAASALVRSGFARTLADRANLALYCAIGLMTVLAQVTIWRSVVEADPAAGPIALAQMVTYSVLSTALTELLPVHVTLRIVDERLRTGNIAIDLLRPIPYPLVVAGESIGVAAFRAVFTTLPILGLAGLLFGLGRPATLAAGVAFALAVLISVALSLAIGFLLALVAFRYLTTLFLEWSVNALIRVFGGAFLPFWFFPTGLAELAGALPFRYLYFVPVAIYLGRVPPADLAGTLLIGAGWALAIAGATAWLWRRALRWLIVGGG